MKTMYICEKCGKQFDDYTMCNAHEEMHPVNGGVMIDTYDVGKDQDVPFRSAYENVARYNDADSCPEIITVGFDLYPWSEEAKEALRNDPTVARCNATGQYKVMRQYKLMPVTHKPTQKYLEMVARNYENVYNWDALDAVENDCDNDEE